MLWAIDVSAKTRLLCLAALAQSVSEGASIAKDGSVDNAAAVLSSPFREADDPLLHRCEAWCEDDGSVGVRWSRPADPDYVPPPPPPPPDEIAPDVPPEPAP